MNAAPADRPRLVVLGTGGTIAGVAAATEEMSYVAGVVGVDDLLSRIPGVDAMADVAYEQVMQRDSCDLDLPQQLAIARAVQEAAERDDVDGVVVTHGTDTMEETAYLLHLVLDTSKPVVLVGAMSPSDALSADGPVNLRNALTVAASRDARDLGVLVVMGAQVHSARELSKNHASRTDAFVSAHGAVGEVVGGRLQLRSRPARLHGAASRFHLRDLGVLPPVELLIGRAGLPQVLLDAVVASGAQGLVYVGHGAGNIPTDLQGRLADVARQGVVVVRTTRVGGGVIVRNGAVADDRYGFVAGDDLGPGKCRILLSLALTVTRDPAQIQEIFDTH